MSIASVASALSSTVGETVFYGMLPDEADDSLDNAYAVIDFAVGNQEQDFAHDAPIMLRYGIEARARATTQATARTMCQTLFDALLSQGFTALSPPVLLRQDDKGRAIVVAHVLAHEVRS